MCSNRVTHSPLRRRRGRWCPELRGTEWPALYLQTDDCPPMSGTVREKQFVTHPGCLNVKGSNAALFYWYLIGRKSCCAAICKSWRPLSGDADFHIAERLPGGMEQHIAGETENSLNQQGFD